MGKQRRYVNDGDTLAKPAENVCEHGDHEAPPGRRFCSFECEVCEHAAFGRLDSGCAGLCKFSQENAP